MPVIRLRQVYVPADDTDALASFFEQALGLELQFRDGDRWVQFRAGDVSLAVASPDEAQGAPPGSAVPVLEVSDLDDVLAAAVQAGASTGEVRNMGEHGRTVLLALPGGTRLALFERSSM